VTERAAGTGGCGRDRRAPGTGGGRNGRVWLGPAGARDRWAGPASQGWVAPLTSNAMSRWLSQEWLDETRQMHNEALAERPGVTARVQYVVTGGPDGDVRFWWDVHDGALRGSGLGDIADPDCTLSQTYADARQIQLGELDPNAAFMQGRIKVAGNMGKLMALLPVTGEPDYLALQDRVRAATDFDD
jgi:putative sterol carrier protein